MNRRLIPAAVLLLAFTAACSQSHEDPRGRGDAPVAQINGHGGDDSPAFCTNMPDEFGNVCGKCVAHFPPWAVIVTTHDQSSSNIGLFQAPKQCGGAVVSGAPPVVSNSNPVVPKDDDG